MNLRNRTCTWSILIWTIDPFHCSQAAAHWAWLTRSASWLFTVSFIKTFMIKCSLSLFYIFFGEGQLRKTKSVNHQFPFSRLCARFLNHIGFAVLICVHILVFVHNPRPWLCKLSTDLQTTSFCREQWTKHFKSNLSRFKGKVVMLYRLRRFYSFYCLVLDLLSFSMLPSLFSGERSCFLNTHFMSLWAQTINHHGFVKARVNCDL